MGGGISQGRLNAGALTGVSTMSPDGEEEATAPVEEAVDKSMGCTGVITSSLEASTAALAGKPGGGTPGFISGIVALLTGFTPCVNIPRGLVAGTACSEGTVTEFAVLVNESINLRRGVALGVIFGALVIGVVFV